MMPLAPTPVMAMPMSKPKIGFSIDAIVGNRTNKTAGGYSPASETAERPLTPLSDGGYPTEFSKIMAKSRVPNSPDDGQTRLSESSITEFQHRINRYAHEMATDINKNQSVVCKSLPSPQHSPPPQTRLSPDDNQTHHRSPPPPMSQHSPQHPAKGPIIVPGIPAGLVRPFPVPPPHGMPDIKSLPPYMNANEMMSAAHNQHFLAAQFQAALANAGHGFPPGGLPPHGPHMHNPNMPRESYPLYPWLLSRHGRIFPHRFPGNFLLQPFRKPKRIRTAFSPSQLLKLEHAFENNHYVVGAERKQLAQNLSLSETQVKVWFQNRRTKHKRMQQEEGTKGKGGDSSKNPGSPSNLSYDEDDELIDMEMDDECPSDEENNQL